MRTQEMAAPLSVVRRLEADHVVLREVLVRQETALETLSELLHQSLQQVDGSSPDNNKQAQLQQEDHEAQMSEKVEDSEVQPKSHPPLMRGTAFVEDHGDEGLAILAEPWWQSNEGKKRPVRSRRDSILASGAESFNSVPSTTTLRSVLKKRTISSSLAGRAQETSSPCLQQCLQSLVAWMEWFQQLQEPNRRYCFARMVDGNKFSTLCLLVILANAFLIIIVSDYELSNLGQPIPEDWERLELGLTIFYAFELTLKILVHRMYFFVNNEWRWNIFDFSLVIFSVIEIAVSSVLESNIDTTSDTSLNLGFLRLLRLTKLAKVLRVFRTLKFFTELRLMLDCVLGSFLQIFWCLAMIVFVLYVFSLLIVQGIVDFLISEGDTLLDVEMDNLKYYYPSVGGSLLTLFQSTTAGLDWRDAFEALAKGGPFLSIVFLVYISIFTISIWNIVTSTFVEKAMKLAKPDLDSMLLEQSMRDLKDTEELENLFRPYATKNMDGEEEISLEDLQDAADEAEFLLYLSVRGIDVKNVKLFFYMLGSMHKNSVVDLKSLVKACVRMKGFATSIDLQSVSFEAKLMHSQTKDLFKVPFRLLVLPCFVKHVCQYPSVGYGTVQKRAEVWFGVQSSSEPQDCSWQVAASGCGSSRWGLVR
ncbi:Scn10a [Symbiodinium natans]|uniref:Scn10a protein n=1 Tax=Symbiodinium natans TaxID=878477 RepID=A0A812RU97_9DINO|nr:Scn10a [Symbiodinium natans]